MAVRWWLCGKHISPTCHSECRKQLHFLHAQVFQCTSLFSQELQFKYEKCVIQNNQPTCESSKAACETPKVIIFMLDDDIIRATKPSDIGATLLLTKLVEWLFKEIARIIQQRKEQLSLKAIKSDFLMVYWVEAPQHKNFTNISCEEN